LNALANVMTGASNVNCCATCVPIMELTERVAVRPTLFPTGARQLTWVVVVHDTVAQTVESTRMLGVTSDIAKFVPYTEMLAPEVVGLLRVAAYVVTGASYVNALDKVPTKLDTSIATL